MLMQRVRAPIVFSLIALYGIVSRLIHWFVADERRRRLYLIQNTHRFCRILVRVLGIHPAIDDKGGKENGHHLIVANHVSYLDVVILAAQRPAVFVTSREVESMKFLGMLSRGAGSLFVERRNKFSLVQEIDEIVATLRSGFSVVIFPEGTSSDGTQVLPFKISLLEAAIQSQVDVLPVCLNYDKINGQKISGKMRDWIFYYGDMEFFAHLKGLLSLESVSVRLTMLKPIKVHAHATRRHIAEQAYHNIREAYVPLT